MRYDLIDSMRCPYCLSKFGVSSVVEEDGKGIRFGLIRCSCFEFPIFEHVLLLSLAKGYGGSEENIQPYVPLQAAAIEYLKQKDLPALERFVQRHIPLLSSLISQRNIPYLEFSLKRLASLAGQTRDVLIHFGQYGILGARGLVRAAPKHLRLLYWLLTSSVALRLYFLRQRLSPNVLDDFYVKRYLSGDLFLLEAMLKTQPQVHKILSLCCGHGLFEVAAGRVFSDLKFTCMDGQILNLFIVKKYFCPEGDFICHDLQFPLPFCDKAFDATFSSTCLQEIPTRASFVSEQSRVTADSGWALFDSFWWPEPRVSPIRHYRFLQNFQDTSLDSYRLIAECSGGKNVFVLRYPEDRDPEWMPKWVSASDEIRELLAQPKGGLPTAMLSRSAVPLFLSPDDVSGTRFMISPCYSTKHEKGVTIFVKKKMKGYTTLPQEVCVADDKKYQPETLRTLYASGVLLPHLRGVMKTSMLW
jgi:SAM-dependent methyltransferase